jgi:transcriptional regulator with XRE-family HTH domain
MADRCTPVRRILEEEDRNAQGHRRHHLDGGENALRRELADFLRCKRERLTPAAAGLPSGRRRKTPGLRREEVAELAGIGTVWYTWLEQGRDIWPSKAALLGIARALRLTEAERKYFFKLAFEDEPKANQEEIVGPGLLSIMAALPVPALIMGRRWDLLAYNEVANALLDLDSVPYRNFLRIAFTSTFRALLPNWLSVAKQYVATFRLENAGFLDPWIKSLVDELKQGSPEFREWWTEQVVAEPYGLHITMDHPLAGRMGFECIPLRPPGCLKLKLAIWVCDGAETEQVLDKVVAPEHAAERSSAHNLWTALASGDRGTGS